MGDSMITDPATLSALKKCRAAFAEFDRLIEPHQARINALDSEPDTGGKLAQILVSMYPPESKTTRLG
jgi:hypothetical protein